jgi:hypothetical protein
MTGAAAIVTAAFLEPPRAGKSLKDLAEGGGGSFDPPPERQEEARGGIPEDSNAEEEEEEDRLEANAAEKLILTNNPSFELFAALGQK